MNRLSRWIIKGFFFYWSVAYSIMAWHIIDGYKPAKFEILIAYFGFSLFLWIFAYMILNKKD